MNNYREKYLNPRREIIIYIYFEEDKDFINTLSLNIKNYYYYKDKKILGKLYNIINKKNLFTEL